MQKPSLCHLTRAQICNAKTKKHVRNQIFDYVLLLMFVYLIVRKGSNKLTFNLDNGMVLPRALRFYSKQTCRLTLANKFVPYWSIRIYLSKTSKVITFYIFIVYWSLVFCYLIILRKILFLQICSTLYYYVFFFPC